MVENYERTVLQELAVWQKKMQQRPSIAGRLSARIQRRINRFIPEKIHQAITSTIKQMVRGVLTGAKFITSSPQENLSLERREILVREKVEFYKKTAAAEGGLTGAGGLLLGLADFPILLALKLKLLFEIASIYGYSVKEFSERVYILHVFQLAFSSQKRKTEVYGLIENWNITARDLPEDIHQFDWRTFQQEYRDYLDLAKMAQLIPVIGAPVGFVVNYKLIDHLGKTAMNAYRMRIREKILISDDAIN